MAYAQSYAYPRVSGYEDGGHLMSNERSFSGGKQMYENDQYNGYPSYAPYVSDEERVLALLSSASSDNLRALDGFAGNEGWNEAYEEKRYHLEQAREVDLDIYHSQPEPWKQWTGAPATFQPFAEEAVMEDDYAYGEDEYDGQNQLTGSEGYSNGSVDGFKHVDQGFHQSYVDPRDTYDAFYPDEQFHYSKASRASSGGEFGAVGSKFGLEQSQEGYQHHQDQGRFVVEQQQQQQQQSQVLDNGGSGIALSGWLAETVWEMCIIPFEPIGQDSVGAGAFGLENDPYSPYPGGYSSPDNVSFRDLQDSPLIGGGSPRLSGLSGNPFHLRSKPSQGFVDFVHRTLGQTLLSPTAVVLSLWYIRRLAIHSGGAEDGRKLRGLLGEAAMNGGGEEVVKRVLTLGLACSNKWLDDNTFTNKSWSDVTLLPLAEINMLELHALGPLKFDLSIDVAEWDDWLYTIDRTLTPFVTDGLAVASAVQAMQQALCQGNAKFEHEIVSRRVPFAPVLESIQDHRQQQQQQKPQQQIILPPLSSVIDMRQLHQGNNNQRPYGGPSAMFQVYGNYGQQQPPPPCSLAPPRASKAARYSYGGEDYGSYLSNLASHHQPRFMSVMA